MFFWPDFPRRSVTISFGTPLCPYRIAYRRAYGLFTSGVLTSVFVVENERVEVLGRDRPSPCCGRIDGVKLKVKGQPPAKKVYLYTYIYMYIYIYIYSTLLRMKTDAEVFMEFDHQFDQLGADAGVWGGGRWKGNSSYPQGKTSHGHFKKVSEHGRVQDWYGVVSFDSRFKRESTGYFSCNPPRENFEKRPIVASCEEFRACTSLL